MKKHILLLVAIIFLFFQSTLLAGCSRDSDFYAGRDEFLSAASIYEGGTRIMHISDVHGGFERLKVILDVAQNCSELVINTGDDANGLPGDGFNDIAHYFTEYRAAVDRCALPVLGVQGNHDAFCSRREYREAMFDQMPFGLIPCDDIGAYGHYDHNDLRIILLDPRDSQVDSLDWWSATFSQKQIDWLIATLDDARNRGLGVVTVMHYPFGDNPEHSHANVRPDINYCQNPFMIPDIIDAMRRGEEFHETYSSTTADGEEIRVDVAASNNQLEHIVHLFGHLHSKEAYKCAKVDGSREYDMLMLGEASLSLKGFALDSADREGNNDIAASLLIIDRPSRQLHRISYGAIAGYRCTTFAY